MKPVSRIAGRMAPLPRNNVDTDQIMPKQHLKRVERTGFGPYVFYDWRYDEEGEARADFILNHPDYQTANMLISGHNFGSGSSREHAPWGLEDWGFEAIVAPSFADIFYNNCVNIGLLPVTLTEDEVAELMELAHDPANHVVIDLDKQTVTSGDFQASFEIDPHAKHRLLNGLDDVGLTLAHGNSIDAHEDERPTFKPTID
ncbi:MAG: 3-isopropylmalate dehydratase small subunit [bacterium]|nr:3-isopropylmalate dehydratase small subunit [bacterium]